MLKTEEDFKQLFIEVTTVDAFGKLNTGGDPIYKVRHYAHVPSLGVTGVCRVMCRFYGKDPDLG
jgi:hypothetical protein